MVTSQDESTASEPDHDHSVPAEEGAGGSALAEVDVVTVLRQWYHVPALAFFIVFMFWTRFQSYSIFRRDGEGIWLVAIDSWYHWRATTWTVENFPWVIGFDPWTGFPEGRSTGQFGTLFDQIVATVALGIGLGSPSEQDILLAALITVPALAALVAIPTYYIGKRIGNRPGGLVGVAFLALTTGVFFDRGIAGMFQHHVAEVLFMSIAVLAFMVALTVAETEKPIWELIKAKNYDEVRRPAIYSAVAGIALTLYIWTWPPGVLLIGILGLFFVIQLTVEYAKDRSPDHLAFVGIVSMVVVALGTAIRIDEFAFGTTGLDLLPPVFALVVAGGCAFMAWLAREWDGRGLEKQRYPAAIAVSIVGSLVVLSILLPGFVNTLVGNISGRLIPIGYSPGAGTVAEVQPPEAISTFLYEQYGLAAFTAFVGMALLVFRPLFGLRRRAEHLFIVIWSLVLFSMALTQVRFNYYYVVPVAVLNAHLVAFIIEAIEWPETLPETGETLDTIEEWSADVETYQLMTLFFVILLLFMPLLPPVASSTPVSDGGERAALFEQEDVAPWMDAPKWEQANQWMAENSPEVGNYGGAGNADQLEYFGRYDAPSEGIYDYPEGAYGVLAWWDYGHFITTQAERIPHANPFQQNAVPASAFFTAQNESQAELYLDAVSAGADVSHEANEAELREAVAQADDNPGIQYVMIDDDIAAGKFPAITQWTGPDYPAYIEQGQITFTEGQQRVPVAGGLDDTMLARLYFDDGEGLQHYRLVHEIETYSLIGFSAGGQRVALPYHTGEWTSQDDGFSQQLTEARENNQAVQLPGLGTEIYDTHLVSALKTFERVEGATLTGESENGSEVFVSLELQSETNRSFIYSQAVSVDEDGTFGLTVPYPTEETLGPDDGYADASVEMSDRMDGYGVFVQDAQGGIVESAEDVVVPEEAVQEGQTVPVDLEEFDPEEEAGEEIVDDGDTGIDEGDGTEDGDDEESGDTDEEDEDTDEENGENGDETDEAEEESEE